MTETLLSPSNVLLFGRIVEDLEIVIPKRKPPGGLKAFSAVAATTAKLPKLEGLLTIDTRQLADGEIVLVKNQEDETENGIYEAKEMNWVRANGAKGANNFKRGFLVEVADGNINKGHSFTMAPIDDFDDGVSNIAFELFVELDTTHGPFSRRRLASNKQLEELLALTSSGFARIYGFSYEGTYYELPRPVLFMVHGDGVPASEARTGRLGVVRRARAPGDPSSTGLAAADFQFAEDLKVWSYDKADYTIRMDVETGMFEDILLAAFFGDGGGVSGAKVSGAKLSGAKLSGSRISGAKVSGAKLWGGRGDATD